MSFVNPYGEWPQGRAIKIRIVATSNSQVELSVGYYSSGSFPSSIWASVAEFPLAKLVKNLPHGNYIGLLFSARFKDVRKVRKKKFSALVQLPW